MRNFANQPDITCFQTVKLALDDMYKHKKIQDEQVQIRLEELNKAYKVLASNNVIPQYDDDHKCFAYLYCYVPAHAHVIYQLINETPELHNAFDSKKIKVSCMGGGPGSDLLGIQKFMTRNQKSTTLRCDIYDRQNLWLPFCASIFRNSQKLSSYRKSDIARFRTFNVTKPVTWEKHADLWDTNLFTMSFFMSEIYSMQDQVIFFENMFEQARVGSFFLFVDNVSVGAEYWFDELVETYNDTNTQDNYIRIINTSSEYPVQTRTIPLESNECKEHLAPHYGRYLNQSGQPWSPRLKTDTVFRICQKVQNSNV